MITISCTHAPEEELLLNRLQDGPWSLILAPRHPERFEEVAEILKQRRIPFSRWSRGESGERVLLVDAMGQLPICYAQSQLAILGGSYVEHVGGHNVLEPALYGTPVFFGPHMHGQIEFAKRALESGAGLQVELSDLRHTVDQYFSSSELQAAMRRSATELVEAGRGVAKRTLNVLFQEKAGRQKKHFG